VTDSTNYRDSILWMADNGVIQGNPDGTFLPDKCVNRAEMLKMAYLASETPLYAEEGTAGSNYYDNFFSDTDKDAWYWPFVNTGLRDEVIQGYDDGTFKPAKCVNRVEALKMILLTFDVDLNIPDMGGPAFTDVAYNKWYSEYFLSGLYRNVIPLEHEGVDYENEVYGAPGRLYYPADGMSRKEVAELIYRTKTVNDNDIVSYSDDSTPNNLNFYVSPSSGVSFMMPAEWTVTSDSYYETAGGAVADYPTIEIETPIGDPVVINQRMMDCGTGEFQAKCYDLAEGYTVGTFSESLDAIRGMKLMQTTFRDPYANTDISDLPGEIAFDGCGSVTSYSHLDWYDQLIEALDSEISEAYEREEQLEDYSEACLALNESRMIIVVSLADEDGNSKVFQWITADSELNEAEYLNFDGEESAYSDIFLSEFLARVDYEIPMQGDFFAVNSGFRQKATFNYASNTVTLDEVCRLSFGEGGSLIVDDCETVE